MKKSILILIIVIAVAVVTGLVWHSRVKSPPPSEKKVVQVQNSSSITTEEVKKEADLAEMTETYKNKKHFLSFKYPKGFTVTSLPTDEADGADTLLINGNGKKTSIQIYISPFTESTTVITKELIQRDLPDMLVDNPQDVTMGNAGKGLAFESGDAGIRTREVWFVYKKKLYQITTYIESDLMLQKILNTFVLN
ncbi:MAG: hypothetical protein EXS50_02130 [Candidatus Taylorbacteria bacterium]|nr:hypothetical protein [Candidatus Taylorbacteria bacterium]